MGVGAGLVDYEQWGAGSLNLIGIFWVAQFLLTLEGSLGQVNERK